MYENDFYVQFSVEKLSEIFLQNNFLLSKSAILKTNEKL